MFYPGQHVLCVADFIPRNDRDYLTRTAPIRGRVYTVREVIENALHIFDQTRDVALRLEECLAIHVLYGDVAWVAQKFRPLDRWTAPEILEAELPELVDA